jgi:hypothetical protein
MKKMRVAADDGLTPEGFGNGVSGKSQQRNLFYYRRKARKHNQNG